MRELTTTTRTTIRLVKDADDTFVVLDHPDAPANMRGTKAGRVIDGGFQATPLSLYALSPETLRGIATLIDN